MWILHPEATGVLCFRVRQQMVCTTFLVFVSALVVNGFARTNFRQISTQEKTPTKVKQQKRNMALINVKKRGVMVMMMMMVGNGAGPDNAEGADVD